MALDKTQKDGILNNLSSVLAVPTGIDRVAQAVLEGDITISELENTGQLTPNYRNQLQTAIGSMRAVVEEDNEWRNAQAVNTIDSYQQYISKYPSGKYVNPANTMIAGLMAQKRASQKYHYIQALKENINSYNTTILASHGITYDDLKQGGISLPTAIQNIWGDSGISLSLGQTPDAIPDGRTEIYFWGTPGSGKTCTLSAILSRASKKGFFTPQRGSGLMYMTQLSSLFSDEAATLPSSTPIEVTQGLSFNLRDEDKKEHPVTLIEISGEIFQCLTQAVMGLPIPDDGHHIAYESLLKFLKSDKNPKYHFFVVDVTNTKKDSLGFTQMNYLQNASLFFDSNNIFNEKTAGIEILVTKSDLLGSTQDVRKNEAVRILKENYLSFINSLKSIAYQHKLIRNLNDIIPVIPFTLGEVYLQNKCIFDPKMSDEIIKILQQNVAKTAIKRKTGWLNR